ncbi:MAG: tRNA pseudouridine(55) synthase TruB, partial [Candidatus Sulfotelmatobacter sp.]
PAGWTSHDVVNRMRRIIGQRSVGHLGTLDPLATGVLPLVTGSFTRLSQFYTTSEKTYEGVIRFGFATNTYDADGDPVGEVKSAAPTLEYLQELASVFLGVIEQVPPPFSAKKVKGVPAYKLARKQKEVVLQPVQVEIKEFVITGVERARAHFRARVASGTYMRSVAHEMGQRLGCGAHLESLRRIAVAEFDIAQALTLDKIEDSIKGCHSERVQANASRGMPTPISHGEGWGSVECVARGEIGGQECPPHATAGSTSLSTGMETLFIHPRQLLPLFPSVTADEPAAARIRTGRPVNLPEHSGAHQVKVFQGQRDLIAIATRVAGTLFHPRIVFPSE